MACAAALVYASSSSSDRHPTCSSGTIGPDRPFATFSPEGCRSATFFEANGGGPLGAEELVRPLLFGLVMDASGVISWGGGFVFARSAVRCCSGR
jgi:hypothetical protein